MNHSTQNYKDLIVWQKGIELAKSIYELTRVFPLEEKFGLISQMRRAAVSIPSNVAEGQALRRVNSSNLSRTPRVRPPNSTHSSSSRSSLSFVRKRARFPSTN